MSIESPCKGVCKLDSEGEYCTGCRRTLSEISQWRDFTDEEKQQVWGRLLCRPLMAEEKHCSCCGEKFECGSGGKNGGCWCQDLPNLMPLSLNSDDCLCPACLKLALSTPSE